ncbi:MAG: DnaK suppressor protein [Candidatus Sumerlaeota bacterium]|nr:DnaK suppressor protein [Candidatus Sumerlaeota bacterium]
MITEQERAELKTLMIDRIAELEASIARLRERVETVSPDSAIGRLSRLDSMINAGTVNQAIHDSQAKLTRLRNRLERIADADFDQCRMCGQPLSIERLRAAPDRGVCTTCLSAKHA